PRVPGALCPMVRESELLIPGGLCPMTKACGPSAFTCGSGECAPRGWLCDGEADCRDGSDELGCAGGCEPGHFPCTRGTDCVPYGNLCDGVPQCHDRSDESEDRCGSTAIPPCPGHFACDGGLCLNVSRVCDGAADCPQGEDELLCGEGRGLWAVVCFLPAGIWVQEPPTLLWCHHYPLPGSVLPWCYRCAMAFRTAVPVGRTSEIAASGGHGGCGAPAPTPVALACSAAHGAATSAILVCCTGAEGRLRSSGSASASPAPVSPVLSAMGGWHQGGGGPGGSRPGGALGCLGVWGSL
uniref:Uncharacterized protein n=1 Tax=Amazona collaria TaxID=241587 RepID=A0A8B9FBZ9_9PSIT